MILNASVNKKYKKNANDCADAIKTWLKVPKFFSCKGTNSFIYKGTIALKIPVQIPTINLLMIIVGPALIKHIPRLIKARKLVNKKQFLN